MIKNAFILSFTAILSKALGAIYQIFLFGTVGTAAGTYTQGIYIYAMLLAISASGVPIAISKLMSEEIGKKKYDVAIKIFKVAFIIVFILGLILSIGLFFSASCINRLLYPEYDLICIIQALSPTLFIVTIIAAFRGYFQGQQNMLPTAYSQIFEQLTRIIFSIGITLIIIYTVAQTNLINIFGPLNEKLPIDISYKIVNAVAFGPFVGAIFAFFPIIYFYKKRKNNLDKKIICKNRKIKNEISSGYLVKRILIFAIPITAAALLPTLLDMFDGILIPQVLFEAGFAKELSKELFSYFANTAMVLINIITLVASSFAISLVPAISDARARNNKNEVESKAVLSIKLVILISLPAAVSIFLLKQPIIDLLFSKASDYSYILQASVFMILFMSIYYSTTGILQGIGRIYVPLISLSVGLVVNIISLKLLLPIDWLNILGAPLSHTFAYFSAATINFITIKKIVSYRLKWSQWFLQAILSALITGAAAYYIYRLFNLIIGFIDEGILNLLISLIFTIIVGVIVYIVSLVLFRVIKEDEVNNIPKINFIFKKIFKIIRRS